MGRSLDVAVALLAAASLATAAPARQIATKKPVATKKKVVKKKRPVAKRAAKKAVSKPKPFVISDQPGNDPVFTMPTDAKDSAAFRYGTMTRDACEAELKTRKVPFHREADTLGVVAPIRLDGAIRGVTFRSNLDDKQRATSPHEILDCRLALALDDFAEILGHYNIVEVRHYSLYRPPEKDWPEGHEAKRHPGGLAIDAAKFIDKDGETLVVLDDFHGALGAKTCGPEAKPDPVTDKATKLRELLCETWDKRLFNVMLTPNYNKPHANHFHLEVTSGVKWFLLH